MIHDDRQRGLAEGESAQDIETPVLDFDLNEELLGAMVSQEDTSFEELAQIAVSSGSVTPLIKEELRCSIQLRLLQAGKEISDSSSECSRSSMASSELSPEEEEKIKRRRERNREAAQRCRKRKRDLADELQLEVDHLESKNKQLKSTVDKLSDEKSSLISLLKRHDKSTGCQARLYRS